MAMLKVFFHFMAVLYLFTVVYASRSRISSFVMNVEGLEHFSKLPVKSIKSPDGDIIDCVHIYDQPAFDHPLLKNHTVKMRPDYYPKWIKDEKINVSSKKIRQVWHLNEKCPNETIPIKRTNKHELPVKSHRKRSNIVGQSSSLDIVEPTYHEHAVIYTNGRFYGAKATFDVWNPYVQETTEFSLAQLWIIGGSGSTLNTIEAGWQVYPDLYRDTNTRLFIYWTNNGYLTGYYNLEHVDSTSPSPYQGMGFIQTNYHIVIGGTISPTSQVDGSQSELTIHVWKDALNGNWWLEIGDEIVGYWPAILFPSLSNGGSTVEWGGEILNYRIHGHHTTTQMGSGHFSNEGFGKASYIKNILTVDDTATLRTPGNLNVITPMKSCYNLSMGADNNNDMGSYFFFGGSGRNPDCE